MRKELFEKSTSGKLIKVIRPNADYLAFVPHPLPPSLHFNSELTKLLADATQKMGELAGIGHLIPNPHLFSGAAIRREAVLSSKIEGTETEIDQLYLFEMDPEGASEKSDAKEVFNYTRALRYSFERIKSLPLSLRLIKEVHEELMRGIKGGFSYPGEFRNTQNWIGFPGCTIDQATYVPPPPEEMVEALNELESYFHDPPEYHNLIRIALTHYIFEAIHPFVDRNGRVGRLLIMLLLTHWCSMPQPLLFLSEFFEKNKLEYYDHLLSVSQKGDWVGWLNFFLKGIIEQSEVALNLAKRIVDLREKYLASLQGKRVSKITFGLIDELFEMPFLTTNSVRDKWKVQFSTAEKGIKDLENEGIVKEITGQSRYRLWVAEELLTLIRGPA